MNNRIPMLMVDWFRETRQLAIADVVFVKGIGICSYQPDGIFDMYYQCYHHRMMTSDMKVVIANSEMLFEATQEEAVAYWDALNMHSKQLEAQKSE